VILLSLLPNRAVFAEEAPATSKATKILYLPLVQHSESVLSSVPGPESEEYQRFLKQVEELMGSIKVTASSDGTLSVQAEAPTVSAAASPEDRAFYRDLATIINLVQSGRLKLTIRPSTSSLPSGSNESAEEVHAAFDYANYQNAIYVALYSQELRLLQWVASDAIGVFVGAVVGAIAGVGSVVGGFVGWYFSHYLQDYIIGSGFPDFLALWIFKSDLIAWKNPTPFFVYIRKAGAMCDNRWRRWWVRYGWWWYIVPDPNCW
jgi:hypothetical protein